MDYCEAMDYINSSSKYGMKLGLERVTELLRKLGNPHKGCKFIHIAGTNGKGSTTAMVSSVLKEAGYKVGMFTSPFIQCFEERVQVDGRNIPKEKLAEFMEFIKNAAEELPEDLGEVTFFEIVTALGFLHFKSERIDIGVIEVGLGGRMDATNVIDSILTIITSISYDHTKILGDTLGKIAYEKAGIIKDSTPLVLYPVVDEAMKVILEVAQSKNSNVNRVFKENIRIEKIVSSVGTKDAYQVVGIRNHDLDIELPLVGEHQSENCAVAVEGVIKLRELGFHITDGNIVDGIKKVNWPGRMEMYLKKPRFVLDGAHNIDAIRILRNNLRKYYDYNKLYVITGMLSDKDVDNMAEVISKEADEIIVLEPNNDRAESGDVLLEKIKKHNDRCFCEKSYENAVEYFINKAEQDDLILATGSFYLIGDIRGILEKK